VKETVMNIEHMLQQTDAVGAISRELGVDPATAQAGATALLPAILSGFQQPAAPAAAVDVTGGTQSSAFPAMGGLGGLLGTIGGLGGGELLDNAVSSEPTEIGKGNEILGQIFGSKEGSRAVAAQASAQSGVEPSLLKKMLPILAMVVSGYVMKQASQNKGGLGGMIGGMLGGSGAQPVCGGKSEIVVSLIVAAGKFLGR
jgi:hypothetical protein